MSRERGQQYICDLLGIDFPYVKMGKIDSYHLFGLETEMMIFALYKHNSHKWKIVADIGANLGLHSILMSKLGWTVIAYEPDPNIFAMLQGNLLSNGAFSVKAHQAAVHTSAGEANFIRVENNLTGSHLEGFKNSYGPRNTIVVKTIDCRRIWPVVDFAKIDSEGNEAELSKTMTSEDMAHMSTIMEVRNEENAAAIYLHFKSIGVPIWAQKIDWQQVRDVSEMPKMNREGSIFVGHNDPWG